MRDLYSHSLLKLLSGHGNHCGQRARLTQVALQFRPLNSRRIQEIHLAQFLAVLFLFLGGKLG